MHVFMREEERNDLYSLRIVIVSLGRRFLFLFRAAAAAERDH